MFYVAKAIHIKWIYKRKEKEMQKEESGRAAVSLMKEIEAKIAEEVEKIKKAANQEKEIESYFITIRFYSPELATYVKKMMLYILNSHN